MASSAELDGWKALGGKFVQQKFLAPTGETGRDLINEDGCRMHSELRFSTMRCAGESYSTWTGAVQYMQQHGLKGQSGRHGRR